MVTDDERIENKIDKIFEELTEMGKVAAVQEQKLREINHRMVDGRQANILSHELLRNEMNKRLDVIDSTLALKVDIEDYKQTIKELRETMAMYMKGLIIVSIILVTGSGVIANPNTVKKILMYLLGIN